MGFGEFSEYRGEIRDTADINEKPDEKLDDALREIERNFDSMLESILEGLNEMEGDKKSGKITENKSAEAHESVTEILTSRKNDLEKLKEINKRSGINTSGLEKNIEADIKKMQTKANEFRIKKPITQNLKKNFNFMENKNGLGGMFIDKPESEEEVKQKAEKFRQINDDIQKGLGGMAIKRNFSAEEIKSILENNEKIKKEVNDGLGGMSFDFDTKSSSLFSEKRKNETMAKAEKLKSFQEKAAEKMEEMDKHEAVYNKEKDGLQNKTESKNYTLANEISKVDNFEDLYKVFEKIGEVKSTYNYNRKFSAQEMIEKMEELRMSIRKNKENRELMKKSLESATFLQYAKAFGIRDKVIDLLKKEINTGEIKREIRKNTEEMGDRKEIEEIMERERKDMKKSGKNGEEQNNAMEKSKFEKIFQEIIENSKMDAVFERERKRPGAVQRIESYAPGPDGYEKYKKDKNINLQVFLHIFPTKESFKKMVNEKRQELKKDKEKIETGLKQYPNSEYYKSITQGWKAQEEYEKRHGWETVFGEKYDESLEEFSRLLYDGFEKYQEEKIKKTEKSIAEAKNFEELERVIKASGGIQGSQDFFKPKALIDIINEVRRGEKDILYVTRTAGLREKIENLLKKEQQKKAI